MRQRPKLPNTAPKQHALGRGDSAYETGVSAAELMAGIINTLRSSGVEGIDEMPPKDQGALALQAIDLAAKQHVYETKIGDVASIAVVKTAMETFSIDFAKAALELPDVLADIPARKADKEAVRRKSLKFIEDWLAQLSIRSEEGIAAAKAKAAADSRKHSKPPEPETTKRKAKPKPKTKTKE